MIWLAKIASNRAVRWALLTVGIILFSGILFSWFIQREVADDQMNQDKGAQIEQGKAAQSAIENVSKANEAVQTRRNDPVVRDAECLRNSDTPENC